MAVEGLIAPTSTTGFWQFTVASTVRADKCVSRKGARPRTEVGRLLQGIRAVGDNQSIDFGIFAAQNLVCQLCHVQYNSRVHCGRSKSAYLGMVSTLR